MKEIFATNGWLVSARPQGSPKPVIKLNAGGLKVGELVSRARRSGLSVEDSIQIAINYGLGQDFEGGFMNFEL